MCRQKIIKKYMRFEYFIYFFVFLKIKYFVDCGKCPDITNGWNEKLRYVFNSKCEIFKNCLGVLCVYGEKYDLLVIEIECFYHKIKIDYLEKIYKLGPNSPIKINFPNTILDVSMVEIGNQLKFMTVLSGIIDDFRQNFEITINYNISETCKNNFDRGFNLIKTKNEFIFRMTGVSKNDTNSNEFENSGIENNPVNKITSDKHNNSKNKNRKKRHVDIKEYESMAESTHNKKFINKINENNKENDISIINSLIDEKEQTIDKNLDSDKNLNTQDDLRKNINEETKIEVKLSDDINKIDSKLTINNISQTNDKAEPIEDLPFFEKQIQSETNTNQKTREKFIIFMKQPKTIITLSSISGVLLLATMITATLLFAKRFKNKPSMATDFGVEPFYAERMNINNQNQYTVTVVD